MTALMTDADKYLMDVHGYLVIKQALTPAEVDAANAAAQLAEGQAPAPLQIEEQPEVEDIGTLIAQLEGLKAKVLAHGQVAG